MTGKTGKQPFVIADTFRGIRVQANDFCSREFFRDQRFDHLYTGTELADL